MSNILSMLSRLFTSSTSKCSDGLSIRIKTNIEYLIENVQAGGRAMFQLCLQHTRVCRAPRTHTNVEKACKIINFISWV